MRVSLWEGTALYCQVHLGDHVIISDGSVSLNSHYGSKVINVQYPDMVLVSFNFITSHREILSDLPTYPIIGLGPCHKRFYTL